MRKLTGFLSMTISSVALAIFSVAVMSCGEKEALVSEIKFNESTVINAAGSGGVYSIPYQVTVPDENESIEAICPQSWVNSFDYSVDGVISFNVDANTGTNRTATVTVLYGESLFTFEVQQKDPKIVEAIDLENTYWTGVRCDFDRYNTIFYYYYNPEQGANEWYADPVTGKHHITAGEFAADYAAMYNAYNPDDLQSVDSFLAFEYTPTGSYTTFYDLYFYPDQQTGTPTMLIEDGMSTPGGGAAVQRVLGEYSFDEATGTITVNDTGNSQNIREVIAHVEFDGEYLRFQITKTKQQDHMRGFLVVDGLPESMMESDSFGLTLQNYNGTMQYQVFGTLVYTLRKVGPAFE